MFFPCSAFLLFTVLAAPPQPPFSQEEQASESIAELRALAAQGDAEAGLNLAKRYMKGEGVPQDLEEAGYWYNFAAAGGSLEAQMTLAAASYSRADYQGALRWFERAAQQGDARAMVAIGDLYSATEGMPKDYAEAVNWYRKAAEQGLSYAQLKLGMMYHNGQGVQQDDGEAVNWFRKAAEQGYAGGQYLLGVAYAKGQGVAPDYVQAHMWLSLAAQATTEDEKTNYAEVRDQVTKMMTAQQVGEAQRLAREWRPKKP